MMHPDVVTCGEGTADRAKAAAQENGLLAPNLIRV